MAEERLQRRLAAILSADVVGYSRLMGSDEGGTLAFEVRSARSLRSGHRSTFRPDVQLMGDGALVEFASAVHVVTCVIEVQKLVQERSSGSSEDGQILFRIGI